MADWDDIRFFLAVAREGSFSRAARTLKVNHSTVSRRIQGMETRHGVKLFNQLPNGYEMTEAAGAVFEQALDIEAAHQQVSRTLFGQDTRLEGRINLTIPNDIFEHLLAPYIARFCQNYPGVDLNLLLTDGLRDLAYREADIAVRLTKAPPDQLSGRRLATLQEAIFAPRDLDIDGPVRLIVWDDEEDLPAWAAQNFPDAQLALRVDDISGMYAAVKAGIGVACFPCYLPALQPDNRVVRLAHPVPEAGWELWVLNHVDLKKTARITHCRDMLIDALKINISAFERAEFTS